MTNEPLLERIVLEPGVLAGKPVIQGTRLSVDYILNLMGHGASIEEILQEYPGLSKQDISACLLFAARSLQDTAFMPLSARAA